MISSCKQPLSPKAGDCGGSASGSKEVAVDWRAIVKARITPKEVAQRLNVGPKAVYALLEQGVLPGIRLGKRWLITWHAYEQWERSCGLRPDQDLVISTGLSGQPEVPIN